MAVWNFKKEFPALMGKTYLNTASSGLLSKEVLKFRRNHDRDFLLSGGGIKDLQEEIISNTRKAVGRFFSHPPNLIALTPNFSQGFNVLVESIPISKKVLLLKGDYPSVNLTFINKDFKTSFADINEFLEENILGAVKNYQPDILALSLVQYVNGIKIDLGFLRELKKEFPELLIFADATQFAGTEDFNFGNSGIDVLGASSYKWLNGGFGNGFFLFGKSVPEKFPQKSGGLDLSMEVKGPQDNSFIKRFERGHMDALNFGSLLTALELIEKIGIGEIEERNKNLSKKAKKVFEELDLLEHSVTKRRIHSSIFNIKGDDNLLHYLRERKIICSRRGGGIRVSFHFFNTLRDLQKLTTELKKWKEKQ